MLNRKTQTNFCRLFLVFDDQPADFIVKCEMERRCDARLQHTRPQTLVQPEKSLISHCEPHARDQIAALKMCPERFPIRPGREVGTKRISTVNFGTKLPETYLCSLNP